MSDCLFCRIIAREIPARIVHEDDEVLAFHDISPQAPTHLLIVPKRHLASLDAATAGAQGEAAPNRPLLGRLLATAAELARGEALAGYRVVVNQGESAGQSVFHLHLHLLGGRRLGWPPG
jgi:histidine triad (HIT) family protein